MQLNPVFNYIKSKKTFSFIDVVKNCQDKVVDTFYIRSAFLYMANGAMIKQVNEPMPNKVRTKLAKIINDIFADELNYEDVYEYRVYEWNDKPDFFKLGKFHKTDEFEKQLGKMTDPFISSPMGSIDDLNSEEFKNKHFRCKIYNHESGKLLRKKYSELSWEETSKQASDEIKRALYYMAIHNNNGEGICLYDRSRQWQRVVDLGVAYQSLFYECNKETCKWTNQQKTFEMFKMYWMIISETENMC